MAKNVVGLFDTRQDAEGAVRALRDAGFPANDISLVAGNAREYDAFTTAPAESGTEAEEGAGIGATGGAVLGGLAGLLVGLGVLTIPGIGPVVAAGSLATVLGSTALGAGIGAAAGGLVGALVGAGIPEEEANVYAESIRRGGTLVMVQVASDEEADRAAEIMDRYNVVDIDERGRTYRESGWERFDASATSYAGVSPASTGYRDTSDYAGATGTTFTSTTDYERVGGTDATTYPRATGMEGLRSESTPRAEGDADTTIDRDDYERSSKVGTAGGAVAGAVTGAAMGSAGGPVGTVIGGAAGALTGGAVGAAGDAAGAEASDEDRDVSAVDRDTTRDPATAYGSARDYSAGETTDYSSETTRRDESMTDRIERATNLDIDRDRDVGGTPRREV